MECFGKQKEGITLILLTFNLGAGTRYVLDSDTAEVYSWWDQHCLGTTGQGDAREELLVPTTH